MTPSLKPPQERRPRTVLALLMTYLGGSSAITTGQMAEQGFHGAGWEDLWWSFTVASLVCLAGVALLVRAVGIHRERRARDRQRLAGLELELEQRAESELDPGDRQRMAELERELEGGLDARPEPRDP